MQLGIDFGTCFSSAAAILPNGTVMRVKDPRKHGFSFPSSAYVTPNDEILVGSSAEYQRNINPQRYCREFKRKLGQNTPYQLGKRQLLPEELVTEVLKKLKTEADKMLKALGYEPLTNCVITIPATYNKYKNDLMQQAAENAGFVEVTLLPEPVATAIYCAQEYDIKDGEIILVYDLGGGTFDSALMQKHGTTDYKFLGIPAGDPHCGGIDFDREIYKDFNQHCSESLQNLLKSQQQSKEAYLARSSVADDCREIKHQLSEADEAETSVIVPGIGNVEYYQLHRDKFNGLIEPLIQKTIQLCQQQVTNANLTWEKVDRIVMVGGSCRIPYIKQLLEQEFGRPTYLVDEPDLAVCLGAAIYGMQLDAQFAQPMVTSGSKTEVSEEPKDKPQNNMEQPGEDFYRQGVEKSQQGDYISAIQYFNQALQINADYAPAYYERGLCRFQLGDSSGAIEDLQKAAKIFFEQGKLTDYQKALQKVKQLTSNQNSNLNPQPSNFSSTNNPEELYKQGLASIKQGNYKAAVEKFNQVINIDSANGDAYLYRGFAYFCLGNAVTAIQDCNQAIQINQNSADAYVCRGLARLANQDYWGAYEDFNQALIINPNHGGAYLGRSITRIFLNQHKVAIADLKELQRIAYNFDSATYNRILASSAKGNRGEVINYLIKTSQLFFRELDF